MSQSAEGLNQFDITIVGGGMVGISLALLLAAQQRWKILVIESKAMAKNNETEYSASFDARSTALSWSSRSVFSKKWEFGTILNSMPKLFHPFM